MKHTPLIILLTGLITSLAGSLLILHTLFHKMPDMENWSSDAAARRILIPHAILLVGLLMTASGAVYLIQRHVIRQRERTHTE